MAKPTEKWGRKRLEETADKAKPDQVNNFKLYIQPTSITKKQVIHCEKTELLQGRAQGRAAPHSQLCVCRASPKEHRWTEGPHRQTPRLTLNQSQRPERGQPQPPALTLPRHELSEEVHMSRQGCNPNKRVIHKNYTHIANNRVTGSSMIARQKGRRTSPPVTAQESRAEVEIHSNIQIVKQITYQTGQKRKRPYERPQRFLWSGPSFGVLVLERPPKTAWPMAASIASQLAAARSVADASKRVTAILTIFDGLWKVNRANAASQMPAILEFQVGDKSCAARNGYDSISVPIPWKVLICM